MVGFIIFILLPLRCGEAARWIQKFFRSPPHIAIAVPIKTDEF
jgi:hypothetical protein